MRRFILVIIILLMVNPVSAQKGRTCFVERGPQVFIANGGWKLYFCPTDVWAISAANNYTSTPQLPVDKQLIATQTPVIAGEGTAYGLRFEGSDEYDLVQVFQFGAQLPILSLDVPATQPYALSFAGDNVAAYDPITRTVKVAKYRVNEEVDYQQVKMPTNFPDIIWVYAIAVDASHVILSGVAADGTFGLWIINLATEQVNQWDTRTYATAYSLTIHPGTGNIAALFFDDGCHPVVLLHEKSGEIIRDYEFVSERAVCSTWKGATLEFAARSGSFGRYSSSQLVLMHLGMIVVWDVRTGDVLASLEAPGTHKVLNSAAVVGDKLRFTYRQLGVRRVVEELPLSIR